MRRAVDSKSFDANRAHPGGCRCNSTDSGGDCDWCRVYYCDHSDVDDAQCLDCGADRTESLFAAAEYAHEGDR
jgi:hypothetical protein